MVIQVYNIIDTLTHLTEYEEKGVGYQYASTS